MPPPTPNLFFKPMRLLRTTFIRSIPIRLHLPTHFSNHCPSFTARPLTTSIPTMYSPNSPTAAATPPTITDALNLLKSRFGHNQFRHGQKQIIEHILSTPENPVSPDIPAKLAGRALAIFPTGAGKSLCYQLPALLFPSGLTLVVSPLLSLMKDQTDMLVKKGFEAEKLDSTQTASEIREVYSRIQDGKVKILFVAPERFKNNRFLRLVERANVQFFVIDEAHCISEWGHSFRPDYLRLARWAERLNCQRRLALTATASPKVAKDVCDRIGIAWEQGVVRLPAVRRELTTRVTDISGGLQERVGALAERLKERDVGPTIVYVTLQKSTEIVASELRKRGFLNAVCYHAGMKSDERKAIQDAFMANFKDGIIVGTIAFGMGLDHAGVRYVYHLNLPKSLEGYIQEIGRAGRDGNSAVCECFASVTDLPMLEGFCYGGTPRLKSVEGIVRELLEGAAVGDTVDFSPYDMSFKHDVKDNCLGQILAQLDLAEGLIEESTPFYAEIACKMLPAGRNALAGCSSQANKILELSDFKRTTLYVDVVKVAKQLNMEYGKVSRIVDDLVVDKKVESAIARKMMNRALVKRKANDLSAVAKRMHDMLLKTQKQQLNQVAKVVEYLGADECQSKFLQTYLGDKVAEGGNCGHCEYCVNGGKNPVKIAEHVQHRVERELDVRRWALIQTDLVLPRDDPLLLARFAAGITSPIISRRYRKIKTFGSMSDHDFNTLLRAAEEECGIKA